MESYEAIRVLVVDEDATCLSILAAMLMRLSFEVVTVSHAYDALVTLRSRGGFDLVISDVHLPDLHGFHLQQTISHEFQQLPVILISSDNNEGMVRQGMKNGALSFIRKPVDANDLRSIRRFIIVEKKKRQAAAATISASSYDMMETEENNVIPGIAYSNYGIRTNPGSPAVRKKMVWTDPLHFKFLDAISSLGVENAVPKNILKVMNVPGLTRENVASHLQKYRQFLKRNIQEVENNGGGYQPRFGPKRVSRLAKLEEIFTQGQLDATSPMGRNNFDGYYNKTNNNGAVRSPLSYNGHNASGNGRLSEQDELMFYRGLRRVDPEIGNPDPYYGANWNNGGSVEPSSYPTLATIVQNNSGQFLNGSNTDPYSNANNNVFSGFSENGNINGYGNVNGYFFPESNYDLLGGVLNGNDGGNISDKSSYGPYSSQGGGGDSQFSVPAAFGPPQEAVPMVFSGYGNNRVENYNYAPQIGPVYDYSMFDNSTAGQANPGGNNHMMMGNGYGMDYNSSGSFECDQQWYDYNNQWGYFGNTQPNFNQHCSNSAQAYRDGNDDFVRSLFATNPYGGAAAN